MKDKIKILHLFSKALDLYGDDGNLKALSFALDKLNISCQIESFEHWQELPPLSDYDLVYIGHGKAKNLIPCIKALQINKENVLSYIENGGYFFCVGNSRELFGKSFETPEGDSLEGLGLFDYVGKETMTVCVSDDLGEINLGGRSIKTYGFVNRTAYLEGDAGESIFKLSRGLGDGKDASAHEGTRYKNFFGSWQLGPFLARNPEVLSYLIKKLTGLEELSLDLSCEKLALEATLKEFDSVK